MNIENRVSRRRRHQSKLGICSKCGKGPRRLTNRDKLTRMLICQSCYRNNRCIGVCADCKKGDRPLMYKGEKGKICIVCYRHNKFGGSDASKNMDLCQSCGKIRRLRYFHVELHICYRCYLNLPNKTHVDVCKACGDKKKLPYRHPEGGFECKTCYNLRGRSSKLFGICKHCESNNRKLTHDHTFADVRVCHVCIKKLRGIDEVMNDEKKTKTRRILNDLYGVKPK